MVGFPKSSYEVNAAKLLAQGYKVARVEQKQTPIGRDKQQRTSKTTDDFADTLVLKRELDRIISPGTVVEEAFIADHNPVYLLSLVESERSYGICLVDTSRSEFMLARLDDDQQKTLLKTLLLQTRPKEIIFRKNELSKETTSIFKNIFAVPPPQTPRRAEEWWDDICDRLTYGDYFSPRSAKADWPDALQHFANDTLVMSALGGCVAYLNQAQLDQAQVSMRNFALYDVHSAMADESKVDFLILDGKALSNLELLENEVTRTSEGSLLELLDHCSSPFGRRLLRRWLCRPLRRAAGIRSRLEAVSWLIENRNLAEGLESELRRIPDLERLLSRCHSQLMSLDDFLRLLDGFELVRQMFYAVVPEKLGRYVDGGIESVPTILQSLLTVDVLGTNSSSPPDFDHLLKSMVESFDMAAARETKRVEPMPGVDAQYDEFKGKVSSIRSELEAHLEEHRKFFKVRSGFSPPLRHELILFIADWKD